MNASESRRETARSNSYRLIEESPDFQELRRKHRSFVFPLTLAFLVWYFLYVVLAAFAPEFMGTKVFGRINVGLIFGLLQFVTTGVITALYIRFANNTMDPMNEKLRAAFQAESTTAAKTRAESEGQA